MKRKCVNNIKNILQNVLRRDCVMHNEIISIISMKFNYGQMKCLKSELNLGITLTGGQSFRWIPMENGKSYRGVLNGRVWTLEHDEDNLNYTVYDSRKAADNTNYEKLLTDYFRLGISLKENIEKWTFLDQHFQKAVETVGGVRILNQDIVENLFSFICSSNNNIIRISSMVEKLCKFFGKKICDLDKREYYEFPSIEALAAEEVDSILRREGFGYRAAYIAKTAQKLMELGGKDWLLNLHKDNNTSYETARESLLNLHGIGPKVADCICLMSLGFLEAIPVDTHIYQVALVTYMPHLKKQSSVTPKIHREVSDNLRKLWGPLAGWAQAIVFCAKINNSQNKSKRKNHRLDIDNEKRIKNEILKN